MLILLGVRPRLKFVFAMVTAGTVAQRLKRLPAMRETWVRSLVLGRSPGEENGNPLQYSCLENPHGWRRLVGYSPRGRKESDTTERLHFSLFFHFHCWYTRVFTFL